ncbi:MAG: hypothetical protein ACTSQ4_02590 [Candidatus Heimdallarchaeaceae archaeon]
MILKFTIIAAVLQMEEKILGMEDIYNRSLLKSESLLCVLWSLNNKLELNIENYVDDISIIQEF